MHGKAKTGREKSLVREKKLGGEMRGICTEPESQVEKWMDYLFGDDWTQAIDDQWKAASEANRVFVT